MATYVYGDYQTVSGYGFKFRSFLTYETNLTDTTCQLVLTAGMQCGSNTGAVGWNNCTVSLSCSDDSNATITKTINYRTNDSDSSQRMTAISAQTWTWNRQNTDTTINITATLAKGSKWAASTATYQLIIPALPLWTITANTQKTGINITGGGWTTGSTTGTKEIKKGEAIGTLPTMGSVPKGYTLLGWYTHPSGGDKIDTNKVFSENEDKFIYAQWQANDYTVTLNNQSATTAGTTTIYTRYNTGVYLDSAHSSNKAMTTSSNNITVPTRIGYTFGGYYSSTNGAGTQLISSSGYITSNFTNTYISSNATLYAKWTVNDYTVTLNNQSATSAGTSTIYTRYNTGVYLNSARSTVMTTSTNPITIPVRTGYTFGGYYSSQNGAGTQLINSSGNITSNFTNTYITANTTLYAKWTANTYNITYVLNGGTHGTNHPISATYDVTFTVNNPTRTGYTFTGWDITNMDETTHYYGNSSTKNNSILGTKATSFKNLRSTSDGTSDTTVIFTATWAANTYTVTFKSGNTTLGTQSFEYNKSQRLTSIGSLSNIPVSSNKGWGFVGWSPNVNTTVKTYSNNESVSNLTTTAGGNVILYGIWSRTVSFKYYSSATATTLTESNSRIQYYRNTTTTGAATSAVSTYAITKQTTYEWEPQGWVLNDNSSTSLASSATNTVASVNPAYNVSANYYALYKRSVTIDYDKGNNNASGSTASTTSNQFYNCGNNNAAIGLSLNLANNSFTWANHTFNGWQYNSSNITNPYTFPNTKWTSSKNITLNATWIGNSIAPQFTIEAIRTDNNGINSDTGESCKVKINAVPGKKYSNSDNTTTNNNTTISVYYKTGTNSYTQSYLLNNGSTVKNASFSNNIIIEYILVNSAGNKITFEQANTYDIKVVLADSNTSVTQTTFLSAAYFALDFNSNATALGIFKAAPDDEQGLYVAKDAVFETLIKTTGFNSISDIYKSINCDITKDEVITQNNTLTINSTDSEWFQALVKAICIKYTNQTNVLYRGILQPNSMRIYEVFIYDTSVIDDTTKLPKYSFGKTLAYSGGYKKFGTNNFVWYFSDIGNTDITSMTGTLAISHGGTGQTTARGGFNNLAAGLQEVTATVTDNTYFISSNTSGTANDWYIRSFAHVWPYLSNGSYIDKHYISKHSVIDLTNSTNAVSAQTSLYFGTRDKNNNLFGVHQTSAFGDGTVGVYMGARNLLSDGTFTEWKGLTINVNKSGGSAATLNTSLTVQNTLQVNNNFTLYREGTTANNLPCSIIFKNKDTTTGVEEANAYISVYNDHATSANGMNMIIRSGGGMFIGSGEAPSSHYATVGTSYQGESTYITADANIYIQSNANTIGDRLGFYLSTAGNVIPCKADTATTNAISIGTADYKINNIYATNLNGVAIGTSPVFTDTKVTQTAVTGDAWRKILGSTNYGSSATASITSGTAGTLVYDVDGPAFNTSSGMIYAKNYVMELATTHALYTAINNLGWTSEVIS